jgi:RNA polymerase sigma factor (sigma-70 family)
MPPPPAEQFAARIFIGPALRAQPDRRLVDLVRDGYDAAFEEIVRRYRRPLDRFAAAIVGGRSEDVTQDAFSKALPALRRSEAEIDLRPWLYRIVRNTALNDLRDRAPATEELSEALPGGRSAAAEAEAREEMHDLMERLRALPEPQRAALVMRELEGLSHEEIAAALGVSGGAARQAIYRARAALRDGFGLLVPLPVLRALAEHGGEASAAGGAIALSGGALKAGMATVLIAGTVGAGVAIEHERGERSGPEAAAAAPLVGPKHRSGSESATASSSSGGSGEDESGSNRGSGGDGDRSGPGDDSGHGGTSDESGSVGDGSRRDSSGPGSSEDLSSGGSDRSGEDSGDSGSSGSGSDSGSGSGSGDRSSGSGSGSGSDDSSGPSSGSGSGGDSGSSGSGDSSGSSDSSGPSGGEDGSSGGDSGSSGPGSGEVVAEPTPTISEPVLESTDGSNSGSGSDSSGGSGSSGSGSGSADSSGLDESP